MLFIDAASTYTETYLCKVFPLQEGGKTPCKGVKWVEAATRDYDIIQAWADKYPHANVGVPTGYGFDAIDCDSSESILAFASVDCGYEGSKVSHAIEAILKKYHMGVVTPRGLHIYVLPTPGMTTAVGIQERHPILKERIKDHGIDYRGLGGYVVGAGSERPDGRYLLMTDDLPIINAPEWVKKGPQSPDNPPTGTTAPQMAFTPIEGAENRAHRRWEKALGEEIEGLKAARKGTRHDTLLRTAYRIGRLITSDEEKAVSEAELLATGLAIGLGKREVKTAIRDGLSKGQENPASLANRPMTQIDDGTPDAIVCFEPSKGKMPWDRIRCKSFQTRDVLSLAEHLVSCSFFGEPMSWAVYATDGHWYVKDEKTCTWEMEGGKRILFDAVCKALTHITCQKGKETFPYPITSRSVQEVISILPTALRGSEHIIEKPEKTHYWLTDEKPWGTWFLCPEGKLFSPLEMHFMPCPTSYWAEGIELAYAPTEGPHPVWDKCWDDVMTPDNRKRLDEIMSVMIYGKECAIEKIPILRGPGGCGKSIILQLLQEIMGVMALSVTPDDLRLHFNSHIVTKRVLMLDDQDMRMREAESELLNYGGGKTRLRVVNIKGQESTSRNVSQRYILACNELPSARDRGGRQARRYWVCEYHSKAPKDDTSLLEKLKEEIPALLWDWAKIYAKIATTGMISSTDDDEALQEELALNENPYAQWAEDRLSPGIPEKPLTYDMTSKDFMQWCHSRCVKPQGDSRKEIKYAIEEWAKRHRVDACASDEDGKPVPPRFTKIKGTRCWQGIQFKPSMP